MGKRGPTPTPTAILKARGSWRGETRDGEPEVEPSIPAPPRWMRLDAREHWATLTQTLFGLGVMADCHATALAMLCNAMARYEKLCESEGFNVQVECMTWDRVMKGLKEFGLTPSSITAVRATQAKDKKQGGIPRLKIAQ